MIKFADTLGVVLSILNLTQSSQKTFVAILPSGYLDSQISSPNQFSVATKKCTSIHFAIILATESNS